MLSKTFAFAALFLNSFQETSTEKDSAAFYDGYLSDYERDGCKKTMRERHNTRNRSSFVEKYRSTSTNSISKEDAQNRQKSSMITEKKMAKIDALKELPQSKSLVILLSPVKSFRRKNEEGTFVPSGDARLICAKRTMSSPISSSRLTIEKRVAGNGEIISKDCNINRHEDVVTAGKEEVVNKITSVCRLSEVPKGTTSENV